MSSPQPLGIPAGRVWSLNLAQDEPSPAVIGEDTWPVSLETPLWVSTQQVPHLCLCTKGARVQSCRKCVRDDSGVHTAHVCRGLVWHSPSAVRPWGCGKTSLGLHLELCRVARAASTPPCGAAHARVVCRKSAVETDEGVTDWIGIQFYQLHGPRQIVPSQTCFLCCAIGKKIPPHR